MKTLLRAAYAAPINAPVNEDRAIVLDHHQIIATGDPKTLRHQHPDSESIDLGNAIILPGLVNAHTHFELTAVGQLPRPASFVDWALALRSRLTAEPDAGAFVRRSVQDGIAQCLKFGVTTVGDITANPAISRPLLAQAGLRGVSYGEVLGMAGRAAQMPARLAAATDRSHDTPLLRAGIEPHAPYSLDLAGYRLCLETARAHAMPLATHLAETPDEAQFLADHTGPFRRLWDALGAWADGVSRAAGGSIRAMNDLGLLDYPTLLAHVNYADDDELAILAHSKASVVYCPRTHAYFRHPPHRIADMIDRGINVAIGTDSCASSGDLNLLADLRLAHRQHPEWPPEFVWSLATDRAAWALRFQTGIGGIESGFLPDLCVFDVQTSDPLREILENEITPKEVWLAGRRAYAAASAP